MAWILPFSIPASIYGLVFFFLLLELRVLKLEQIEAGSGLLLAVMPVLFVPAGVGLLENLSLMKKYLIPIILIVVVTTAVVMLTTGITAELMLKYRKGKDKI